MCQNNCIPCCFPFLHITWTSTSAFPEWIKEGLVFHESCSKRKTPTRKELGLQPWLTGMLALHGLILLGISLCPFFLGWLGSLTGRNFYPTNILFDIWRDVDIPTIPSTHLFFFFLNRRRCPLEMFILSWGNQILERDLVVPLMQAFSFWEEVFSNASEIHFQNFKIKLVDVFQWYVKNSKACPQPGLF